MHANENESDVDAIGQVVIGAAYEVSNVLGAGFLEKLYARALIHESGIKGQRA